ncbi:MAG: ChaN family lipoprotein [Bdellovibrionales bacterium]|nr:ChaN family lipoprotein [Bdellovibrionales bacterium]
MLFPKENWIKIRKQLLKQVKQQVYLRLGADESLNEYQLNYKNEFKGRWAASHESELLRSIENSHVVLGGDFHAFSQSQRTHLRILRKLRTQKNVVLALECIESKYQKDLEKYLSGKITQKTFMKRVQWNEHWGFPFDHYQPLLELCKSKKYKVIGINDYYQSRNANSLKKRDAKAAHRLVQLAKKNPESIIYCIFGDLHLARQHIPKYLNELDSQLKVTTVFQNSDELYFKLARQNIENKIDVLKSSHRRYCIVGSPPWVKWQSYLMFLEQSFDLEIFEEDEDLQDYTDYVGEQIQFLAKDLGFQVNLDDLAVYCPDNEEFKKKLEDVANREKGRIIRYHIENDKSYYCPEDGYLYLSRLTVNHAAELAGAYIQAQLSGRKSMVYKMPEDFLRKIWIEALSFFCSKLINHKRKSESMLDLKIQLSKSSLNNKGQEALLLALDQRLCEILMLQGHKNISRKIKPKNKAVYIESARILGQMLGERIYRSYRDKILTPEDIHDYFKFNIGSKKFNSYYLDVVKRVEEDSSPVFIPEGFPS